MQARSPSEPVRYRIPLHRARRTLLSTRAATWIRTAGSLIVGEVLTYLALRFGWPLLMEHATAIADATGRMTAPLRDSLLGISNLIPVPFTPALNLTNMLWTMIVALILLTIASLMPGRSTPLRYWFSGNVLVIMLAALYAFFSGHLGYDGTSYMALVERTSILMILCAPIFIAFVTALLPFSLLELCTMLVLMVGCDAIFAAVRIVAYALLINRFGAIAEMNLYMFFGPLMDVVYFITIYSLIVVPLGKRLNAQEAVWQ